MFFVFITGHEYNKCGLDKMIVHPDLNNIYTKRMTRLLVLSAEHSLQALTPNYPSDAWKNSLIRMPPFISAEMNHPIESSGKRIGNAGHHSIPTSLRKAKTFLNDRYLKDINNQ